MSVSDGIIINDFNLEFNTNGAIALINIHSINSGVDTFSNFNNHEFCVRKSNCCPCTSVTPGGMILSFTPTSSGNTIICDIAVEYDIPVVSNDDCDCAFEEEDDDDVFDVVVIMASLFFGAGFFSSSTAASP